MKIAILSDVHGDTQWISASMRTAKKAGVALFTQVGDLGVEWNGPKKTILADRIQKLCEETQLDFLFIRGNHENLDALLALKPLPGEVFCRLRQQVWYLPDGEILDFEHGEESVSIAGLGGATSIDREWRLEEEARTGKPQSIYWPSESVDPEAAIKLMESGRQVDLLLTHEAPLQMIRSGLLELGRIWALPEDFLDDQAVDQALVTGARAALKPRLTAHGHFHQRVTLAHETGLIIGLGMEGDREGSLVIWDSETGEVTDLRVEG